MGHHFPAQLIEWIYFTRNTVAMAALDTARHLYRHTAKEHEGHTAQELGDALERRAEEIRSVQQATNARMEAALSPQAIDVSPTEDMSEGTQRALEEALGKPVEVGMDVGEAREVADRVERAGSDLREAFKGTNAKSEDLPEGVAGQAFLSQAGTASFDAIAMEGTGEVVDVEMAKGTDAHELFHTLQAAPDVDSVVIPSSSEVVSAEISPEYVSSADTITAHEFIEAGAIAAQEEEAPASVERLSDDYLAIRAKVARVLSRQDLLRLSREGKLSKVPQYAQAV